MAKKKIQDDSKGEKKNGLLVVPLGMAKTDCGYLS